MRFLVDENLPPRLAELLTLLGHDVLMVAQTPLRQASDLEIAEAAIQDDRIVVTRDIRFPTRTSGPIPGLILLRLPQVFRSDDIAQLMEAVMRSEAADLLAGHITVVRPTGTRSRTIPDA